MNIKTITLAAIAALATATACETEDPGPLQEMEKDYAILDFDEIEIGDGFNIRVEQSNTFRVNVQGDSRNIHDLDVFKTGTSLVIRFDENAERRHQTYITIGMPKLRKVNFSGGSVSVITGFESDGTLDLILSGGSASQVDAGYRVSNFIISGGSTLKLFGLGDELNADVSGASTLSAFDFPVRDANVQLSGASLARVTVSDNLSINASGASHVSYRGNPSVSESVSGGSSVESE